MNELRDMNKRHFLNIDDAIWIIESIKDFFVLKCVGLKYNINNLFNIIFHFDPFIKKTDMWLIIQN